MSPSHVVVDGSNIATEGRSTPSLQQLDDAIRQFQAEFPDTEVIVVVDATFGHRIDPGERAIFDEAVAHGELVSPPAGAIGRGDAFVLRVAERVGAQVLSNDSFQEFHAEHPWLFEEGRLMGGKPVPGVGWIFTPRLPVRGPRSRAATTTGSGRGGRHRKDEEAESKPARPRGTSKIAAEAIALATVEAKGSRVVKATKEPAKATKATKGTEGAKAAKVAKTAKPAEAAPTAKSTRSVKGAKVAKEPVKAAKATKAPKAAKTDKPAKTDTTALAPARGGRVAKATGAVETSRVTDGARKASTAQAGDAGGSVAKRSSTSRRGRRGRGTDAAAVRAAIEAATEEALGAPAPDAAPSPPEGRRGRRQAAGATVAPAAVNDPLTFLTFVTEHPLGSSVLGTVSSFVSHGAMVDVDGMSCYLPLTGLGDPPPRRAREVVDRGEQRPFVVVALDPPRRGAELALPEVAQAGVTAPAAPVGDPARRTRGAGRTAS
ncbi:MAG TPA: hypothetical protein VN791_03755 [Acidimicrobiales bacterium]|nr:hypothetical protein [Acidimicrobiales bacterium]